MVNEGYRSLLLTHKNTLAAFIRILLPSHANGEGPWNRVNQRPVNQLSIARAVNPDLMQLADFESIPRPDDRRRTILFDHRRAGGFESRRQRVAVVNQRVDPAAGAADIDAARLGSLRFSRCPRQS